MSSTQTTTIEVNNHGQQQTNVHIPSTIRYRPLPADFDEAIDRKAPSLIRVVDVPGGYPCRKCLKDGEVGDKMRLISYDPWLGDSPYRQYGPIFVHEEPQCKLAELSAGAVLPEQQRKRDLSVRAFSQNHLMVGFDTIKGTELINRAEKFFDQTGDEHAEYIHVHYPGPGCFAVRIDRGESTVQLE